MKTVFFKMPTPVWSIKATLVVLHRRWMIGKMNSYKILIFSISIQICRWEF